MLACIFVDLQVFCSHSRKSRLLVAFLVILVFFFSSGRRLLVAFFIKNRSSFRRLFIKVRSSFYLTTLYMLPHSAPSWILSLAENLARSILQDGATKWYYYHHTNHKLRRRRLPKLVQSTHPPYLTKQEIHNSKTKTGTTTTTY